MKNNQDKYKTDILSVTGLMVNFVGATAVLFIPTATVKAAQHDGWMSSALAILYGAYIVYIVYRLGILFPGKTFIEYLPLIIGKAAGKILGLIYILFLFDIAYTTLREALALFYGTGAYRLTPPIILAILLIIASTYAVLSGFEAISRTFSLYWLVIASFYVITVCLAIPYIKLDTLLPLGEADFANILKGSFVPFGYWGELFFLSMILPYMKKPREGLIAANIANILLTIFLTVMIAIMVTIQGVETTSRSIYALFFLGDFIPPIGIKIFLLSLWVIAFWGKITLTQFMINNGISQLLNLKSYRCVVFPVAALIVVLSFSFFKSVPDMMAGISITFPGQALFLEYLIPTLLLITALIKSKFKYTNSAPTVDIDSQS